MQLHGRARPRGEAMANKAARAGEISGRIESQNLACVETGAPLVSVIIPHYNDLDNLHRCLRLLQDQTLPRDAFEIVVADNNSRYGLGELERVCGTMARVVPASIQGAGPARNAAIAASRGTILAFTDSDCRPSPTWLERGAAALATADMVGGRVEVVVEDEAYLSGVEAFERVFAFNFKRYVEELGFCGGANMFVSRAIFDRVGPFRAEVTEDMDWGKRASAAKFRWRFAPEAVVSHPARRTWPELKKKLRRRAREDFAIAVEQPNGRFLWFLRSIAILASPLAHWIKVVRSDKLETTGQRLKAIVVLFRARFWRFIECNRLLLGR
jgi:glycosyltransferase involved in cell wall biosynthesis